jgi:hypothetical protein
MMLGAFSDVGSDFGDATVYRADCYTLRVIKLTFAIGALGGINDVNTLLHADSNVRALWFAGITRGAGFGIDFVGHGGSPVRLTKKKTIQAASPTLSAKWV